MRLNSPQSSKAAPKKNVPATISIVVPTQLPMITEASATPKKNHSPNIIIAIAISGSSSNAANAKAQTVIAKNNLNFIVTIPCSGINKQANAKAKLFL